MGIKSKSIYPKFVGAKCFFVDDNTMYLTSSYKKYLKDKEAYESMLEVKSLKEGLDYQQKHYGEVDQIMLDRLIWLLNNQK